MQKGKILFYKDLEHQELFLKILFLEISKI